MNFLKIDYSEISIF